MALKYRQCLGFGGEQTGDGLGGNLALVQSTLLDSVFRPIESVYHFEEVGKYLVDFIFILLALPLVAVDKRKILILEFGHQACYLSDCTKSHFYF